VSAGFFCVLGQIGRAVKIEWPSGLGAIVAIIVLVLAIVLMVVGQMDIKTGSLIAALAVARLT
jgi:hypothetical protein